jgi:hypothetical protein
MSTDLHVICSNCGTASVHSSRLNNNSNNNNNNNSNGDTLLCCFNSNTATWSSQRSVSRRPIVSVSACGERSQEQTRPVGPQFAALECNQIVLLYTELGPCNRTKKGRIMPYKPLTHLPHEACFVAYFHFSEAAYIKLLDTKGLLSFHVDSGLQ